MVDDADATLKSGDGQTGTAGRTALLAIALGLIAAVAGALLLWSSEGGAVFLAQAFAALAACF